MYDSEFVFQMLNQIQDPDVPFTYIDREKLKIEGWLLFGEGDIMGAMRVLLGLYARSREAAIIDHRRHPGFADYVAMMMDQDYLFAEHPEVREEIIKLYGRKEGIPLGTYWLSRVS